MQDVGTAAGTMHPRPWQFFLSVAVLGLHLLEEHQTGGTLNFQPYGMKRRDGSHCA